MSAAESPAALFRIGSATPFPFEDEESTPSSINWSEALPPKSWLFGAKGLLSGPRGRVEGLGWTLPRDPGGAVDKFGVLPVSSADLTDLFRCSSCFGAMDEDLQMRRDEKIVGAKVVKGDLEI